MAQRIASAKIPEGLLEAVDEAAARQGMTRNAYMRLALEAATDGSLELQSHEARTRDLVRARLSADTVLIRAALIRPRASGPEAAGGPHSPTRSKGFRRASPPHDSAAGAGTLDQ